MNIPNSKLFETVDAMDVRKQFGILVDKVRFTNQRYLIQRRGKPTALLVPLADRDLIQNGITSTSEDLDAVYEAFEKVCGTISDQAMKDASSTIDIYVYQDGKSMGDYAE